MASTAPGITIFESDNSAPTARTTTGVPAGIVGTAAQGPAYVPLTFSTYNSWEQMFGAPGTRFGPIAVNSWLSAGSNNKNATYIRVLGAGDGKKRNASTGEVNRAGFTVGEQQVLDSGIVGPNSYASSGGVLGRTYFLGCFMSESAGSTLFSGAGIQASEKSIPIIRGVLMTPSGVTLTLSGNSNSSNQPAATAIEGSSISGSIGIADNTFVLLLNGLTDSNKNVITASFDNLASALNTDVTKYQEYGHYLYSYYDVPSNFAVITGSQILTHVTSSGDSTKHDAVFITSSSLGRNTGDATTPNFEQFKDRYQHPTTPYVISQDFGGTKYNLFKLHSIHDGALPFGAGALADNTAASSDALDKNLKVTISNITPAVGSTWPTFSLSIRPLAQLDESRSNSTVYANWDGLTLDPNSSRYIAAVIGDQKVYFDFDKVEGSQKLVVEGDYRVTNNYVRVEMSSDFLAGNVPYDSIPAGYRGYSYPYTSGTSLSTYAASDSNIQAGEDDVIRSATVPPVPVRLRISNGVDPIATLPSAPLPTWGTQVEQYSTVDDPSKSGMALNQSIYNYTKFFPSYHPTNANFFETDPSLADAFCNNYFSIENIQVVTGANGNANEILWASASYVRQGNIVANPSNKTRALSINDLAFNNTYKTTNIANVSYTFMLQGGFDGVNIFDAQKSSLSDLAARREIADSANQGGVNGPTVAAYKKAIDIMGSTSDANIQLLVVPGLRVPAVTDYAVTAVESRFDALYIMDIEQVDTLGNFMTSSDSTVSIPNTVGNFLSRNLNTSFAAAYFPDVNVPVPRRSTTLTVPPSAAVLYAYALNDTYAPWYAPAGLTRGLLTATSTGFALTTDATDLKTTVLYDADINPIVNAGGSSYVAWGQKTLLQTASSLDRINVRRLLIDVRRRVRAVANSLLFEPNTQDTLARFNSLVKPIMQDVQNRFGVERYRVIIDTSTTTQADIDNNTIRGKIYLQPTRTAEFIEVTFNISATSTT